MYNHAQPHSESQDLGESMEVEAGMGDEALESSILDGTVLDKFHSAADALKFAYAHDSPEKKKALMSQMKEQPASFQEGGLRNTMDYYGNLRRDADFMQEDPVQAALNQLEDVDSVLP